MTNHERDLDEDFEMTNDERDLSEEFGFRSDAGRRAFIEGRHGRSLFAGEAMDYAAIEAAARRPEVTATHYDDGRLIRPGTGHRETGHLSPAVGQASEEVARWSGAWEWAAVVTSCCVRSTRYARMRTARS